MSVDLGVRDGVMTRQRRTHRFRRDLPQTSRTLDIREQKSHRARRRADPHGQKLRHETSAVSYQIPSRGVAARSHLWPSRRDGFRGLALDGPVIPSSRRGPHNRSGHDVDWRSMSRSRPSEWQSTTGVTKTLLAGEGAVRLVA
jgi:hypothetical protein